MIKAVIFDFDDTLVNTFETKALALQHTARELYAYELALEKIKAHWGKPYHEMMLLLFEDVTDDLDEIIKNFEEIRKNFPAKLFDHVNETITVLKEKVELGILTSAGRSLIVEDLKTINLSPDNFFYIQTFEDTVVHKPDPDVFVPMLEKLQKKQITKDEIVYVGDSLKDYYAARGAGLAFYGVANTMTLKERFEKESVHVLTDIIELLNIVES